MLPFWRALMQFLNCYPFKRIPSIGELNAMSLKDENLNWDGHSKERARVIWVKNMSSADEKMGQIGDIQQEMSYRQMTLHEPYMSNADDATRQTCSEHSFPSTERNIPVPTLPGIDPSISGGNRYDTLQPSPSVNRCLFKQYPLIGNESNRGENNLKASSAVT